MEIKRGNKKFYVGEEETPLAELLFSVDKDVIFAEGTEVSKELGGKGVGKLLLKELVDWARKENKKIKPICPFVKATYLNFEERNFINNFHTVKAIEIL